MHEPTETTYQRWFADVLARRDEYPAGRFDGRGIVMCAGGARMYTCAWICLNMLQRELQCTLPIQVWHLGPGEMGAPMQALLEELGVEVVDAFRVREQYPVRTLGGWEMKPYAVIHAPFREVLLLDADNLPVVDPAFLFESGAYERTGAIFWPDIGDISPNSPIWRICGVPYRAPSIESGQMVLDKARCWKALQVTMHLNEHSDFYYPYIYGDKDTFQLAWLALGQEYSIPPYRPKTLVGAVCQRDFDGRVLFQHRNTAKWILRGDNPAVQGFRFEAEARRFLADLRERWNGRIFHPPERSADAVDVEAALARQRWFEYNRVSSDHRRIELLPGHRIGAGWSHIERHWYVADGPGGPELVFEGDDGVTCRLHPDRHGFWAGRCEAGERMPVELRAVGATGGTARWGSGVPWAGMSRPDRADGRRDCDPWLVDDLLTGWIESADPQGYADALAPALRLLATRYGNVRPLLQARLPGWVAQGAPWVDLVRAILRDRDSLHPSEPGG